MKYLSISKKISRLVGCSLLLGVCLISLNCSVTKPQIKEHAKVGYGKAGDIEAWEKAKGVMENYDWIVLSQDLYKGQ